MSKFSKEDYREKPKVSTAALPDIVFMLLFYFMVAAAVKSTNYENFVEVTLPKGNNLTKVSDPNLVNYVYVGIPRNKAKYGNMPNLIVSNDRIITLSEIPSIVSGWRNLVPPERFNEMQTMLSIHKNAQIGIVQDVEDALGAAKLPRIMYAGNEGDINDNFKP